MRRRPFRCLIPGAEMGTILEVHPALIPSIPFDENSWRTLLSMYYAEVGLPAMLNKAMPDHRTFASLHSIPTALAQWKDV